MGSSSAARVALVQKVEEYLDDISLFITREEFVIEPHERDEARDNLDNALFRLEASFGRMRSALSRERNSSILAASLPPEIMVEIFGCGGIRTTLLATRVCHKWRVSALNHAPLWSRVNMESRKYSEGLLQMQLERSGSYPLDLTFRLRVEGSRRATNRMIPEEFMSIVSKASSIANLSTRTVSQEWSDTLPLLESLHLCVDPSTPAEQFSLMPLNLRHYSVDFNSQLFPLPPQILRNLSTLHLKRYSEHAMKVLDAIVTISCLRELLLDTCENNEDLSPELIDVTIQKSKISSLRIVSLKQVSKSFLACFLRPGIVTSTTNLRIEPSPPPSLQLQRGLLASSIWIEFTLKYVLYQHSDAEVFTQITLGEANEALSTHAMPTFVSCEALTALFWTGGNLKEPPFLFFPSLARLGFEFHPARVGEPRESLAELVGSYLASSCPRLQYLGISICRPKMSSSILQRDDAEDGVSSFLEAWVDFYGELFSTVEIYDENRPQRWKERSDVLKACARRFEIKQHCVLEGWKAPTFPSLRTFVTGPEEDEREEAPFRGFAQTFW